MLLKKERTKNKRKQKQKQKQNKNLNILLQLFSTRLWNNKMWLSQGIQGSDDMQKHPDNYF